MKVNFMGYSFSLGGASGNSSSSGNPRGQGDAKQRGVTPTKSGGGSGGGQTATVPGTVPEEEDASANSLVPLTMKDLEDAMAELCTAVAPFETVGLQTVSNLQDAVRNHGRVDLMRSVADGGTFAVKRMPTRWVRLHPKDFADTYPTASERPWYDFGFVRILNKRSYPYCCDLKGIYRDEKETFVVTSLAAEGDLFSWCDKKNVPGPGRAREAYMRPVVAQIFMAVRWLHEIGIAHRDISLENILLDNTPDGGYRVKMIDFGMSCLQQTTKNEVRGKQSYQAPEMHQQAEYHNFLADAFAVGVVVFSMAAQDYPWTATKRNTCQLFEYVAQFGFERYLKKRKLRKGDGQYLAEVFSPEFTQVLEGLLALEPKDRICLGERCLKAQGRRDVWDLQWTAGAGEFGPMIPIKETSG